MPTYSSFTCMAISKMLVNQFVFAVNRTCKVRRMRSGEYANLVRISSSGGIGQQASTLNGVSLVGRYMLTVNIATLEYRTGDPVYKSGAYCHHGNNLPP